MNDQARSDVPAAEEKSTGVSGPSGPQGDDFFIVGIGASAGGLEALERLFQRVSDEAAMAYVVVQHLSPDFDSVMDELLLRQTDLPIKTATDGMVVQPNTIYLMPAKKEMIISGGRLLLTDKDPDQGLSLPIDTFFRSLAQDAGDRAIGVILSGTGSDGSRGIQSISDAGGLVLVQSEDTAKFDGMPRNAIETGVVDLVLPPESMADALSRFGKHPVASELALPVESMPVDEGGMNRLLRLLRDTYGIDFSLYKPTTVTRRIQRRLLLNQSIDFDRYVEQIADDPEELSSLYRDLLVGVTHFFRDREAFELIQDQVIPELLERVPPDEEIRIWVAGCATGEEAYSLGILLHEQLTDANRPINAKIFATDVHQHSLDFAALGVYPKSAMTDLSEQRRARYFNRKGDHYQVAPELRKIIVFARHNIIKDAPFTRLDLVSCRNLLIYFQPPAQKKAISLFHFGLKTGGVLFLGPSEGVGDFQDEFTSLDHHWKVYRKRRDVRFPPDMRLPLAHNVDRLAAPGGISRNWKSKDEEEIVAYAQLVNQFVPPSVLVNERREILHLFSGGGNFLQLNDGRLSNDLLDHCSSDLRTAIAGALQRAAKERNPVSYTGVIAQVGDTQSSIKLGVTPLLNRSTQPGHFLITFEPIEDVVEASESAADLDAVEMGDLSRERIVALETELSRTRENLQATIEELETSNEELHATNEELVASNEELQSTNEELHSVNEELYTVNAEYQRKITELTLLNEDMDNLLASTEVGVIFLDDNLCIRKFTPHISRLFNIVGADIGRMFDNFTHNIEHDGLMQDVQSVQQSGDPIEKEVRDRFGHWHLLRIFPYRSKGDSHGIVVALIDVQSLKFAQQQLRAKDSEQQAILEHSPAFIFIKDLSGTYTLASGGAQQHLGAAADRISGRTDYDLLPQSAADRMEAQDRAVSTTGKTVEDELEFELDGEQHCVLSTKYPLRDEQGRIIAIAGMWIDILRRTRAERRVREALQYRDRFLAILSHELRNPTAAMHSATQLLRKSPGDEDTVRRATNVLSRQLDQTKRLLDDLLELSRITQGAIELRKQVVDLRDVVHDAAGATRPRIAAHDLTFDVSIPEDPQLVYGDPSRLQQAVVNLLVNSAKYTPAGGHVSISLARKNNHAIVEVSDTGVGMSRDLQQQAFDPFVQADETLSRSEGGMGIGLTLVKSLVELHQGAISVASDGEGLGTTFSIRLPITTRIHQPRDVDEGNDDEPVTASSLRLLLVEDNDDAREMLKVLLESEGHVVETASDGTSALAAIEDEQPDVALIDIGLPELNGYEVAKRVRQTLGLHQIRLIALTGYGQASDRKKSRDAGFDMHLTKPVDLKLLKSTLAAHNGKPAKSKSQSTSD